MARIDLIETEIDSFVNELEFLSSNDRIEQRKIHIKNRLSALTSDISQLNALRAKYIDKFLDVLRDVPINTYDINELFLLVESAYQDGVESNIVK